LIRALAARNSISSLTAPGGIFGPLLLVFNVSGGKGGGALDPRDPGFYLV